MFEYTIDIVNYLDLPVLTSVTRDELIEYYQKGFGIKVHSVFKVG